MEVLEAIRTRRSIGKLGTEPPPRETLERILEAATYAPNHYLNQPWKFIVLAGKAREELGQAMAEALVARGVKQTGAALEGLLAAERAKPLRAPVLLVVAACRTNHPVAMEIEDIKSTSALTQNVLLAAHAEGLGAYWRTGDAAYDDRVKVFLGLRPEDHIVGFIYIGYPAEQRSPTTRMPLPEKIEWRGWDS